VLRDLAFGSYTIRIERNGYEPEERKLELTARRPTYSATIPLQAPSAARGVAAAPRGDSVATEKPVEQEKSGPGGLNVQSRPTGARVYVNDQLAGSTPIAVPDVPAGPVRVRIELDGYQPWVTVVRVSPGGQTKVAASLER